MIISNIRALLERLNDSCTKILESSIGACVNRGHYEVRWEHLLLESMDRAESDIAAILDHFAVDKARLLKALQNDLEALPEGNTGKPTFSLPLLEMFEHAWTLGSLNYNLPSITSGTLFVAALEKGQGTFTASMDILRQIPLAELTRDFNAIVKSSPEQSGAPALQNNGRPGGAPAQGTEALDQFCTNFTEVARNGKIDPVLGRDDEIRQALDILNRRRKNNPILVGEAGVGKTAIVEGLALRIAAGDVPENMKNVELWGLDLGLLQAGASVKGEFEKRLKNVIEAIKGSVRPAILFIDEAHTLIGAGGSAGQGDAANLLKPALARGELRTLAATTWSEYRKYFEKDPALARRFQLIKIEEPDEKVAMVMLRGVAEKFENHHNVHITSDGAAAAVTLSHRYISGRQLPDKAVDVLDTACARVKMSQTVKPAGLDRAERACASLRQKLAALQNDARVGVVQPQSVLAACTAEIAAQEESIARLSAQWEAEKKQAAVVAELQKELGEAKPDDPKKAESGKKLSQALGELTRLGGEEPMVFPYVNASVCGQVIADWTGVPIGSLLKDEAATLLGLEEKLCERIAGQNEALYEIANAVRAAKTGLGNPDAPLGVFLFCGPSGVGKTECALALTDQLFGGDKFLTTINMSEYQEKHTVSQLKGSPPGYVGYGEGGILTEAVRQKPYSIVLLDEVEKAHLEVMNLFYQVFDKGFMRDGEGREIDFRNTIIIMTSNLASQTIMDQFPQNGAIDNAALIAAIRPELSAHFKPALLGRCRIIPFRPLSSEVMKQVIMLKLDKIARRLTAAHGITLSCSPEMLEQIAVSCTAVDSGARNADAVIGSVLLPAISKKLLSQIGDESGGDRDGETENKKEKYNRIHVGVDAEGNFDMAFFKE
ncbi:MAG: type VI secretion system ATPase TssH [Chitinivibrionales bacterium]|nr:type VI secretion system ATPase TssH [Chitinivibrionales bacterium]